MTDDDLTSLNEIILKGLLKWSEMNIEHSFFLNAITHLTKSLLLYDYEYEIDKFLSYSFDFYTF